MAIWIVGLHNELEGENKLYTVEAENQRSALIRAAMNASENEERAKETEEWLSNIDEYDGIVTELANGEIICTDPLLIDESIFKKGQI